VKSSLKSTDEKQTKANGSIILGIESSCDETAVAIVCDGWKVLSSQISSQIKDHKIFGGVVPEIASRKHLDVIYPLTQTCLKEAGIKLSAIDCLAVSQGPGLIGSLLVGISFAKGLAYALNKPLIPVDHVKSHMHGALLGLYGNDCGESEKADLFPALALVVSGGHTNLYIMKDFVTFDLVAQTMDDACGECFDKVAKLLGLGYPGGAKIESMARQGEIGHFAMPQMVKGNRLAFSYSGLKTHAARIIAASAPFDREELKGFCADFQEAALEQIVRKLAGAISQYPEVKNIFVAGGVAANERLRKLCSANFSVPCLFPELRYCSDNAAMVASYAYHVLKNTSDKSFTSLGFDAYSRYDFLGHTCT
jgi:N6-L-threonylcarbamoyladenine synthase